MFWSLCQTCHPCVVPGQTMVSLAWIMMNLFKKLTIQMQSDSAISFLPSPVCWEVCFGSKVDKQGNQCLWWYALNRPHSYRKSSILPKGGGEPDRLGRVIHKERWADSSERIVFLLQGSKSRMPQAQGTYSPESHNDSHIQPNPGSE